MLTRIACCIKSIAIKRPNNSPATRVNRLIIEQAPKTASKKSKTDVHTQTLHKTFSAFNTKISRFHSLMFNEPKKKDSYHAAQAKNNFCPKSFRSLAKSNMKVYIKTVGSATPSIRSGCPPMTEWIIPQSAVDASVCTAVKVPSVRITIPSYAKNRSNRRNKKLKLEHSEKRSALLVFLSSCTPKDITGIADAKNM